MSFVNEDVWLKPACCFSSPTSLHNRNDAQNYELTVQSWSVQKEVKLNLLLKWHFLALLSSSPVTSQSFSSSLSAVCMRHRCVKQLSEERLNKQAGPGTKNLPLRDMWQQNPLNPHPQTPPKPTHPTLQPRLWSPHTPTGATQTVPYPELGAKRRNDGGGGGANSDSYSLNVTTSQRGLHDTATKSELMDSFFSPANMTGGVCVSVRGCGRRTGGWWGSLFAPFKGHMRQWASCDIVSADWRGRCVFPGALTARLM